MTKAKKILALFLMIACIAAGTLIGYHMGTEAGSTQAANEKDDLSDGDTQTETEPEETEPAETGQAEAEPAETGQAEAGPAETEPAENEPAEAAQTDMSGDYMGDIPCPLPPKDSPYRLYPTVSEDESCILVNVENIDDANIRLSISSAVPTDDGTGYTEDILFPEHIAHYNGEGYYEYYDEEHHIYLKFNIMQDNVAGRALEVYGTDSFFDPNQYNELMQYKGISGNLFHMGIPGAG